MYMSAIITIWIFKLVFRHKYNSQALGVSSLLSKFDYNGYGLSISSFVVQTMNQKLVKFVCNWERKKERERERERERASERERESRPSHTFTQPIASRGWKPLILEESGESHYWQIDCVSQTSTVTLPTLLQNQRFSVSQLDYVFIIMKIKYFILCNNKCLIFLSHI